LRGRKRGGGAKKPLTRKKKKKKERRGCRIEGRKKRGGAVFRFTCPERKKRRKGGKGLGEGSSPGATKKKRNSSVYEEKKRKKKRGEPDLRGTHPWALRAQEEGGGGGRGLSNNKQRGGPQKLSPPPLWGTIEKGEKKREGLENFHETFFFFYPVEGREKETTLPYISCPAKGEKREKRSRPCVQGLPSPSWEGGKRKGKNPSGKKRESSPQRKKVGKKRGTLNLRARH